VSAAFADLAEVWDTHAHVFPAGFAAAPDAPAVPDGPSGVDAYRGMMATLGVTRPVLVQPNAYGLENSALLAGLAALGPDARGVAAVAPDAPAEALRRLHATGVRGARIMDLGGGAVPLDAAPAVAAMVRPLGWTPILQFDGAALPERLPMLAALPGPWVLDHMGKCLGGVAPAHVDAMRALMDGGCVVKLCAFYEWSRAGPPDYDDAAALAEALVAHRPDALIWGSNWPHLLRAPADRPDDAALLETVLSWLPPSVRKAVFETTPARLFGG
jgi:D-galactarolactone isomerase